MITTEVNFGHPFFIKVGISLGPQKMSTADQKQLLASKYFFLLFILYILGMALGC
jgi:hypothetical protein